MKSKSTLRNLLLASSSLLAISYSHAATLYWDGGTINIVANGNGVSGGTAGNWDTTLTNWDQGNALAHVAWVNANNDTAVLGGTAGTVTLTAPVTVGGLTFFSTSGYTVTGSTLTLGAAENAIRLINATNVTTSSATITSTVAGTGNAILSSISPTVASTLTFAGSGGWSGSTTVNAGLTMQLNSASTALLTTSGITFNGGTVIQNYTAAVDRINDSAPITASGGTFATLSPNAAIVLAETIGSVALTSGQTTFVHNASGASLTSQNLILSGLTRTGATNASSVVFASSGLLNITKNIMTVTGAAATPAGQIIAPWATSGNTATQTDYAVYNGAAQVVGAGIAATAESTWMTGTDQYTADDGLGGITLTGTRNVTALRNVSASTGVTATNATDVINLAAHTFADGDAFAFNAGTPPTGLALNTPYFVVNAGAGTFQLATTQGGTAINFTTDGTSLSGLGVLLVSSSNNLGTTGILNSSANTMYLAATGTGAVTLPSATSGQLHVNSGAGPIQSNAPITDNGAGVLTLVKNGPNALTLSATNTHTGGTVVNAGQLNWTNANQLGASTFRNISVNGIATLNGNDGTSLDALSIGSGGLANFTTAGYVFTSATGSGVVSYRSTTATNRTLNLGNASSFTGTVQALMGGNTNMNPNVQFSSIGDTAGSALQFGGGSLDSTQGANFTLNGAAPLVFNNRQLQILMRISGTNGPLQNNLFNNSALAANTWIINTDLSVLTNQTGRNFNLRGTNTGLNAFNGVISDGNFGGTVNLTKQDAGTWGLGGNNTHSGGTSLTGGKLNINNAGALGTGTFTIGAATFDNTSGSPITNANNNAIAWNGDSTFTGTNALNLGTGNVTLGGNRNLNIGGTLTVGGVISGAAGIQKQGSGTLILTGSSTYTLTTVVNGGTLAGTNAVQSFGTNLSGINIQGSGTLSLRNDSSVSFTNGTNPYNIANSASGATINVNRVTGTGTNTITVGNLTTSSISGIWGLNFTGANGVSLSAGNLNTPVSTVVATHTITNNIAGGGSLTLASVFNQATTIASPDLVFTGTGTTTITGAITQTLADMDLTKNGAGSLLLNGTNTYTGLTTVSAGTLGGTGSIAGNVTVAATGSLAPGASAGTFSIGGVLDISAQAGGGTGKLNFELGPIASSDKIALTGSGSLTIGGTLLDFSDFNFSTLTGLQNGTYKLITSPNAISGGLDTTPANLTGPIGAGTGTLQITGNDVELLVSGIGAGSAYDTWKTVNAPSGDPDDDFDLDGVSNAVEFVLGGLASTNDLDKLPTISASGANMIFTFKRDVDSIDPKTGVSIEVGTDLVIWNVPNSPYAVPDVAAANNPGVTVVEDTPAGFDTVTLTVPQTPDSKKFARLKVVITP